MSYDVIKEYRKILTEAETVTQTTVNKKYTVKVTYNVPGDATPKEIVLPLTLPTNATNIIVGKPQ